ncbi:MAG TPA: bis(5'-nucleosyl)-tetraphosphatase [archaeon]|nr:bis(5'-nucleosyl)-tetraphosphatase [archaeon]
MKSMVVNVEISAGVVLFRKEQDKVYYLLLHYQSGHWDFPKGHVEKGEHLQQTAIRELKEETGIGDAELLNGFKEEVSYFFKKGNKVINKKVVFFAAETMQKEVVLSSEHAGYKWLPYKEALAQATFKNAKQVLEKADKFLFK